MATTFSDLRTRLMARMGVTVSSVAGEALLDESLNAALQKVTGAGAAQLRETYTGIIIPRLSTTVTAHTAATASITLDSVAGVYPGDILQDDEIGSDVLIRTVNTSTKVIGIGIAVASSINGNTVTVIRRSFELPHAGQVIEVRRIDAPNALAFDPMAPAKYHVAEGEPRAYTQSYAANRAVSYINLWPAPAVGDQFVIVQNAGLAEDATIDASEGLLTVILAEALKYRRLMGLQAGAGGAAAMADDLRELRQKAGGGSGIVTRGVNG